MTEQRQFKVKQIVWGKVSDYPWWPARIIKTLAQRNRNIYRVHFFGDPTYCYLQSQQLIDFESGLASFQEGNPKTQILKKPIQLALAAYKKSRQQKCYMEIQSECVPEVQPTNLEFFEESKIQSKFLMENIEKQLPNKINETNQSSQKTEIKDYINNLNTQNVIQQITGGYYQKLKASKGYNKRKQLLTCQLKIKQLLLQKYNLVNLYKHKQASSSKQNEIKVKKITKKNLLTKRKQRKSKQDIITQSGKKLIKIIRRNLGDSIQNPSSMLITIMQWLNKNPKKYHSRYIKIIKTIRQTSQQINIQKTSTQYTKKDIQEVIMSKLCRQDEMQQQIDVSYSRLDGNSNCYYVYTNDQQKKYDEQKSKVTQVEAHIV